MAKTAFVGVKPYTANLDLMFYWRHENNSGDPGCRGGPTRRQDCLLYVSDRQDCLSHVFLRELRVSA